MSRGARWLGILEFGGVYAIARLFRSETKQTALSVAGVALAVGLVLTVTGIAVGLAAGPAVGGTADYWIVPEDGGSSVVAPVGGQRLGQVHESTARIQQFAGVRSATPVLLALAGVDVNGSREYLLVIGVIPNNESVVGLSTAGMRPGDPYYANGTYEGRRTGEIVLSTGAADTLGRDGGDTVTFATGARAANRTFEVAAVTAPTSAGIGQLPVALVHLSELQTITGAATGDTADRIRVSVTDSSIRPRLAGLYPHSKVVTDGQLRRQRVLDSRVTVAVAVASFVVAVVVGCLFIATTMGFELAAQHRSRAVMHAIGISRASILAMVTAQTLTVCLLGGVTGVALWLLAGLAINLGAGLVFETGQIVALQPVLAVGGLGAAILMGLLTLPYLLVVSHRTADIRTH